MILHSYEIDLKHRKIVSADDFPNDTFGIIVAEHYHGIQKYLVKKYNQEILVLGSTCDILRSSEWRIAEIKIGDVFEVQYGTPCKDNPSNLPKGVLIEDTTTGKNHWFKHSNVYIALQSENVYSIGEFGDSLCKVLGPNTLVKITGTRR